jgi:hypothetical protein
MKENIGVKNRKIFSHAIFKECELEALIETIMKVPTNRIARLNAAVL